MNFEDADYHEIVGIECHGYITNNPETIKALIENNVPFKKVLRGVAKILAYTGNGIHWVKLATAPTLEIKSPT